MLQDYKAAQKVAAEREATSLPRAAPQQQAAAAAAAAAGGGREEEVERQALLQAQAMEEARLLDSAMTFNEALIEERDHGIQGGRRGWRGRGAGRGWRPGARRRPAGIWRGAEQRVAPLHTPPPQALPRSPGRGPNSTALPLRPAAPQRYSGR